MKTFLAAFLGVLAAAVVIAFVFGTPAFRPTWRTPATPLLEWLHSDDGAARRMQAKREVARSRNEQRREQEHADELQEQRRERVTLLAATLGVQPVANVTRAEAQLFQQANRNRAQQSDGSAERILLPLHAPVQIDEWTTLRAGTPVEIVGYARDNSITMRYEGARYEIAPWQVGLPVAVGFNDRWCGDEAWNAK